jgi:glycosyltransferase involved in cell wall biosynthesis
LYHELRERNYYQGDLKLVIGAGDKYSQSLLDLKKAIDVHKYSQSIQFITNLPYNQLINSYLSAEVLIVPMRKELQDIAGFHHKVGEYCASKRPFISNRAGEIGYYFTDNQTAILADEFTIQSYLIRLQDILKDSSRLNSIGQSGNDLGRKILDYQINGKILGDFITKLS